MRIRIEHTIGVLKGRFQSLHELRINVSSHNRHLYTIMWCRACIILHNLIIRIEGDTVDERWMEELLECGRADGQNNANDKDIESESDDDGDNLTQARQRLLTPGKRFCHKLMSDLFDSPHSGAVHRL